MSFKKNNSIPADGTVGEAAAAANANAGVGDQTNVQVRGGNAGGNPGVSHILHWPTSSTSDLLQSKVSRNNGQRQKQCSSFYKTTRAT
jgi:hypothetical protein